MHNHHSGTLLVNALAKWVCAAAVYIVNACRQSSMHVCQAVPLSPKAALSWWCHQTAVLIRLISRSVCVTHCEHGIGQQQVLPLLL